VLLRNINPVGEVWVAALDRVLEPGEVVDVPDDIAGTAPSAFVAVDVPDKPWLARVTHAGGWEQYDPGTGLLAQVGNWEVADAPAPVDPPAPFDAPVEDN